MKIENVKHLSKHLTEVEGLKKQISIAQMDEIIGKISDTIAMNPSVLKILIANGVRRTLGKTKAVRASIAGVKKK